MVGRRVGEGDEDMLGSVDGVYILYTLYSRYLLLLSLKQSSY